MKTRYTFLIAPLLVVCSLGCNKVPRPDGMPETFPITFTIMQDGVPLEGATVSSSPVDTELTRWSGGARITDASGKTIMYSYGLKGLIAGEHTVVVTKEICHRPPGMESSEKDEYELFVDPKFWSHQTTPLRIDVQRGTREFTLDVEPFDPKTFDERRFNMRLKK